MKITDEEQAKLKKILDKETLEFLEDEKLFLKELVSRTNATVPFDPQILFNVFKLSEVSDKKQFKKLLGWLSQQEEGKIFDRNMQVLVVGNIKPAEDDSLRGSDDPNRIWFLQKLKEIFTEDDLSEIRGYMQTNAHQDIFDLVKQRIQEHSFFNEFSKELLGKFADTAQGFTNYILFNVDAVVGAPLNEFNQEKLEEIERKLKVASKKEQQKLAQEKTELEVTVKNSIKQSGQVKRAWGEKKWHTSIQQLCEQLGVDVKGDQKTEKKAESSELKKWRAALSEVSDDAKKNGLWLGIANELNATKKDEHEKIKAIKDIVEEHNKKCLSILNAELSRLSENITNKTPHFTPGFDSTIRPDSPFGRLMILQGLIESLAKLNDQPFDIEKAMQDFSQKESWIKKGILYQAIVSPSTDRRKDEFSSKNKMATWFAKQGGIRGFGEQKTLGALLAIKAGQVEGVQVKQYKSMFSKHRP